MRRLIENLNLKHEIPRFYRENNIKLPNFPAKAGFQTREFRYFEFRTFVTL